MAIETVMTNASAYVLGGPDIKASYCEGAPVGTVCPRCGSCLDRSYHPATMDVKEAQRYDFGNTLDLQPLFSKYLVETITNLSGQRPAAKEIQASRAPLLIVGKKLKETIDSCHFPGIYFHDAYCASDEYNGDKVH